MKFGFRKPSLRRYISAMTTAPIKRAILREIIPEYGKKGMGWANPKKAAYNHLYDMATVNPLDLATTPRGVKSHSRKKYITQSQYEMRINEIDVYKKGIIQCNIIISLFGMTNGVVYEDAPIFKAVNRLFTYTSGYMNKPMNCGFDYCEMCEDRLNKIHRINPTVKSICLDIVHLLKQRESSNEIFQKILAKYELVD